MCFKILPFVSFLARPVNLIGDRALLLVLASVPQSNSYVVRSPNWFVPEIRFST